MDNKGADKLTSDLEHCTDLVFNARTDSRTSHSGLEQARVRDPSFWPAPGPALLKCHLPRLIRTCPAEGLFTHFQP